MSRSVRTLIIAALALGFLALIAGAVGAQTARGALGQPDSLSFAAAREVALGHYTGAMVSGMFNGGPRADLAIVNNTPAHARGGTVTMVRELNGRFGLVRALKVPPFSSAITAADVNRNGKLDLLLGTPDNAAQLFVNTASVFLGAGNGTFGMPRTSGIGTEWRSPAPLLVADVNGNHRVDLVTASAHKLVVMLGRGDCTFAARRMYVIDTMGFVRSLAVADVNGDGKLDVVAGGQEGANTPVGTISVLLGNGHGAFGPAVTTTTGELLPHDLAIADLNRDGKRDLVVNDDADLVDYGGGANHAAIVVYSGNGDGTFTQAHEYDLSELGSGALSLRDLDGDGNRDAVIVLNSGFDVLLGDGDGGFEAPVAIAHAHWTGDARLAVADFNGDRKLDVAVSDLKTLSIFLNTSSTK